MAHPRSAPDRPNVLVIMADQMKATASHLYGSTFCQTPSLARLAEEGVLFRHAFTPHPLCVPARVALWTGQYPHRTGSRRNETLMRPGASHAFRAWHGLGYHCGLIGKNHCFEQPDDLALFDTWCEITHGGLPAGAHHAGLPWVRPVEAIVAAHATRRAMPQVSPRFSYAVTDYPIEDYGTSVVAAQAVRFLEERRREPFALWVSFPDPHEPYEAPRRYADLFPREAIDLPPWRADEFSDPAHPAPERNRVLHHMTGLEDDPLEDVYGVLGVYHAMVRMIDDGVGRILDALERLGLRRDTIVVFLADHGDFAGEHCAMRKGGAFYDCLTRVPLVVSCPGTVPAARVDESLVNLVDVVPTLYRLQGLDVPRAMQGQPLPTVTDAAPREAAFSEYGAGGPAFTLRDLEGLPRPYGRHTIMQTLQWREAEGRRKMVRTREWKYVQDPLGDLDELYDLAHDPWELANVAADPAYTETLAAMRLRLADWSIRTEDAVDVPLPDEDKYELPG